MGRQKAMMREENNRWQEKDPENLTGRSLRRAQDRQAKAYQRYEARLRSEEERRKLEAERRRVVPIEQFQSALESL
jgi:hypothetical protein